MSDQVGSYHVVDLSPGRRVMINMLNLSGPAHNMYGLLEVDVTVARQFIEKHKERTGETLSFTGFLTLCLARAVDEDKAVQAYLKGRKQLVLFDDVDVGLMVERKIGEKRALMGHVIRGANHKTYLEIHQEIRSVQSKPVPRDRGLPSWFRTAMLLPWPLSKFFNALFNWTMRRDPTLAVSMGGTVSITAVGMFGEGHSGWGIFPTTQVLGLVVGSIASKPAVVEGRIEPREILHLTVVFDHDVIDGAPAARFTRRLMELIESGYGLDADQAISAIATEPA
jgi:pyruvate/2-oxoglutarate dehydrogenase complex dihydrolipoamide acyltransferase (E2) component